MEPLSALAVATSVVQFVDFAGKLLSGSTRLYKSADGRFEDHADLHTITQTLSKLSGDLQRPPKYDSPSQHIQELRDLCRDASLVAEELIEKLNSIKLQSDKSRTRWRSGLQALRSLLVQERIDNLQERVNRFRQQLTLSLVVILREEMYSSQYDVNDRLESVFTVFQEHIKENQLWQTDIGRMIREQYKSDPSQDSTQFSPPNITRFGLEEQSDRFARLMLQFMKYTEMGERHERISDRHRKTFEWIFHETPNRAWSSFPQWLKGLLPLYWITGKAGAGKSTLMKLLHDDSRTEQYLSKESCSKVPVVKAGFFLWNSGTSMQMSQHGLVQSLLFQILNVCPEMTPSTFPDRWETFSLLGSFSTVELSWTELLQSFRRCIQQIGKSKRLFFLIDGLDEYAGKPGDIIGFLKQTLASPNSIIKMCISSRPWTVFEDAFDSNPSLHIHELTLPDMRLFISDRFKENAGYSALKGEEPDYAEQLIEDVAQKASGVFLWVSLVVELLLAALSNGDRIKDLQKRLQSLPPDLEGFFQKILDSQEPEHKEHASQLFQVFRAAMKPVSITTFTFADEDTDTILNAEVSPVSVDQLHFKIDRMRRRLNSRCKGLIEVAQRNFSPNSSVEYLHRTVKDFMEKESTWGKVKAMTPSTFDPHFALCKSFLMQLKKMPPYDMSDLEALLSEFISRISQSESTVTDIKIVMLDQLDDTLNHIISQETIKETSPIGQQVIKYPGVQPHWTHTGQLSHETFMPGTFMNFVVSHRYFWYLESKISQGFQVKQAKGLAPLLYSAIIRPHASNEQVDVEIVKCLLEHGADPNESFGGRQIWDFSRPAINMDVYQKINDLLLQYGKGSSVGWPMKSKSFFHRFKFRSRKAK
ncbi:hypothetical protein CC78DRAFT_497371 [Lojkania enalia]|uniref:NACHT domain-containing protein n=1 Tax=Lojkania enalia TaxID=147567 RepID=A0A9P4N5C0_9PLEO|nr:hypothetical protein CC78DRAFT_497371 [Didymosphaeria enalia]